MPDNIDWDGLIAEVLQRGTDVPEVPWFKPGEDAAYDVSSAGSLSHDTHLADRGSRPAVRLIHRRMQMLHAWLQIGCCLFGLLVSGLEKLCWQRHSCYS